MAAQPWLLAFVVCACSVDQRQLELAAADGGSGSGGAAANDGGGAGTAGTDAGSGLVDGCADLDTDGVADCRTTLLKNPSFTADVSDWIAASDTVLAWDAKNALADSPSGSAKLSGTVARLSVEQCVSVQGSQLVIAYANAFVAAADSGSDIGQALLEVSFFDDAACGGTPTSQFSTPPDVAPNVWTTVQAGAVSAAGTASVSVALVGFKNDAARELDVYFDNVMLKAQAP